MQTYRQGACFTLAATVLLFALAPAAVGQTAAGDPADVSFRIVNATTGQEGSLSRLTLDYVTYQANLVAESTSRDSAFTLRAVPVEPGARYIVTAWKDGVPYWWSKRGRDLTAGPVVLHVFDNAAGAEGLTISGMDVVLAHEGATLKIQYMVEISNQRTPQATIFGSGPAVGLAFPQGATAIEATYLRGPEPMPVETSRSGGRLGLDFPVTPGSNRVQIEAIVPWSDGMSVDVGSNLEVAAWSLLGAPQGIEIRGFGIREATDQGIPGYTRFTTDEIDAGDRVALTLHHAGPGEAVAADIFAQVADAEQAAEDRAEDSDDSPSYLPLIFLGGLLIVILVGAMRRRG